MVTFTKAFRPSQQEIERRYRNVRAAMERAGLDALVVSGSEYTGFEGAVRYLSGFHILHRYAYVVIPAGKDPVAVFPREATWVGDHTESFLSQRELPAHCGQWMADYLKGLDARRVGIYGMEYIMNVRDYRALAATGFDLVDFDEAFDHTRAQKSDEEIASVRHSMEINKRGVLAVIRAYESGRTEAELMGVAEQVFSSAGCSRSTMDMVQMGPGGSLRPQMVFPTRRAVAASDGMLYGLEIAGEGGHWVEYSRPLMPEGMDAITADMMTAHQEFHALVRENMKAGCTAEEVYRQCMKPIIDRGYRSGHVCGHSIGMTMIELPRIGEGSEFVLPENMVYSMHPHIMNEARTHSLYFQETYRVTAHGGEPLSGTAIVAYDGSETELHPL